MTRQFRRQAAHLVARAVVLLLAAIAVVPLLLVLAYVTGKGLPTLANLDFFTHT